MNSFYYKTFARLALLPYIGGTVIHIVRLIYNFPTRRIFPYWYSFIAVGYFLGLGYYVLLLNWRLYPK